MIDCDLCGQKFELGEQYCPDCMKEIEEANASFVEKQPVNWEAVFAASPTRYTEKQIKRDQARFAPRPFSLLR